MRLGLKKIRLAVFCGRRLENVNAVESKLTTVFPELSRFMVQLTRKQFQWSNQKPQFLTTCTFCRRAGAPRIQPNSNKQSRHWQRKPISTSRRKGGALTLTALYDLKKRRQSSKRTATASGGGPLRHLRSWTQMIRWTWASDNCQEEVAPEDAEAKDEIYIPEMAPVEGLQKLAVDITPICLREKLL